MWTMPDYSLRISMCWVRGNMKIRWTVFLTSYFEDGMPRRSHSASMRQSCQKLNLVGRISQ